MILENLLETQLQILYIKGKNRIDFFNWFEMGPLFINWSPKKVASL